MSTSIVEQPTAALSGAPAARRRGGRLSDPAAVAALAAVVSGAAAGRPSLWFDEGATISASASRSLPQLWRLLGHIDAVHGLYYLLMHGWFTLFPPTEFWSRVPSCLAVATAAAGVVVFAKQFSSRTLAGCAGVLFAILPRTTWAGVEARSYALSAAAAVWLTVLLVSAARRNRLRWWLGYAVALILAVLLNINLVLLVPVHGAVIPVVARGNGPGTGKSAAARWAAASSVAVSMLIPFIVFAHGQIRQVGWISPLNWHNVIDVVQQQYFDRSVPFAVLAGVLIVAATVTVRTGARAPSRSTRSLVLVCTAWIVVPTAASLIYSAIGEPIYYPRYLTFTAPAMAVVLAAGVVTVARQRWAVAAVLILFAGAAFPNYLWTQRGPYAKEKGWDYSQVADVIAAHATPGDCLLVDNTVRWAPGPIRALLATRPAAFRPLIDVGRGARGPERGTLWDGHVAVWLVLDRLAKCATVWTISSRDKTLPDHQAGPSLPPGRLLGHAPAYQFAGELGFHIIERWQFHFAQVTKSIR
ncbi:MAG: glycosyltransferase family 39 protein [Mycobacterium sp.]|uniref:glycosyltransferase family 39 protein n=1 Tax=Mycobacterium sp. TaxID=1785 RepID=UPI00260C3F8B|nr:glycosyltransferase family 39 protein [Mycobacterium sp.]MDI3315669.1 glycosyltransferase family 39 protein [Mycobacterium sp.]